MNASSMLPTPAIKDWLTDASYKLSNAGIPSPKLDAEIILANTLDKDRTYLHAHPEQTISPNQIKIVDCNLELRLKRMPIAYIIGHKEFYGREFKVSSDTLIPRPESETIIELLTDILENNLKDQSIKLVDVGTGSGCLGITAKLEFPDIDVTLIDVSETALTIATENAKKLSADVNIIQSDLFQNYPSKINIIIANLPYVDQTWDRSPETNYEPDLALFADNSGLSIIEDLITQTDNLIANGFLLIEADPVQHVSLIKFASNKSLQLFRQDGYIIAFKKIS